MHHHLIDKYASLDSPLHRRDERAKIISSLGLIIICVSTPPQAFGAFVGYLLVLTLGIAICRVPLSYLLRRSLVIIPFVLTMAIFIPFVAGDEAGSYRVGDLTISKSGLLVFWNVLIKSYVAVLALILLSATTGFDRMLNGLARLKAPSVLVTTCGFAWRYVFVLVDEALRMKRARDARCYGGRWLWHAKVVGQMIGMLFVRSYERAERVYQAMLARGFEGKMPHVSAGRLDYKDGVLVLVAVGSFLLLRIVNL